MYVTLFISSHVYRYLLSSLLFVLRGVLDGTNGEDAFNFMFDSQQHYFIRRSSVRSPPQRSSPPTMNVWFKTCGLYFFFFLCLLKCCLRSCTQRGCFLNHCHADKVIDYKLKCMKRAPDRRLFANNAACFHLLQPAVTLLNISYLPICFCVTLLKSWRSNFTGGEFFFSGLCFFFFIVLLRLFSSFFPTTTMSI